MTTVLRHGVAGTLSIVVGAWLATGIARAEGPEFESPPVHPVELSFDGTQLYAVHQADHRFLVYDLAQGDVPERTAELLVGLDPVTVRQRTATEVWVVNHLSDSVSIIDLVSLRIVRTLRVGDEPTDVVFAGSPQRAFVCVSQEDRIVIYDPENLDAPPQNVPLEQSDPTALAVSRDGQTVYVAAFDSGNHTSTVRFQDVEKGGGPPSPNPPMDPNLPLAPRTALIVQHDGTAWRDESGRSWNQYLHYRLLDHDVIGIDAATGSIREAYSQIGTSLLGIAVGAANGRVYVSNQEAFNLTRFEPNLNGRFLQNRVTVIDPSDGSVTPRHLNEHIDYTAEHGSPAERALSLSMPMALAAGSDGTVYVTAFGSDLVGVLDAEGTLVRRIEVGDGPCGVALDEARQKLYVVRRTPGALAVVDLGDDSVQSVSLGFDPHPLELYAGRKRFYSGELSSAHGDLSCASCHLFGGMDNLAWDLGDPEGEFDPGYGGTFSGFHPMKGPMATQSLRALPETEPFHWRGDRATLRDFNGAFVSLMGLEHELDEAAMGEFEHFVSSLVYPPNPYRDLDGSLPSRHVGTPDPIHGEYLFDFGGLVSGAGDCNGCHSAPTSENGTILPGVTLFQDQDLDVPHLRNMYEKTRFDREAAVNVRGFGFAHDGATDEIVTFLKSPRFEFASEADQEDVAAFVLMIDTGTHAAVGDQYTMRTPGDAIGRSRIETLMTLADEGVIGLIAKGNDLDGAARGWMYRMGRFTPDRLSEQALDLTELSARVSDGHEITFTAVYFGWENRLGIDRDRDSYLDRDELDAGSDPGDPNSMPGLVAGLESAGPVSAGITLEPIWPNPAKRIANIAMSLAQSGSAAITIHDVNGRLVRKIADGVLPSGRQRFIWDLRRESGDAVSGGVYFVRARTDAGEETRRVLVRR